jgi:phosphate transport system permease protein
MEKNTVNSEESLIKPKTLDEVRAMIRAHKRNDFIFSSIGLLTIIFALLTLLILFVDLVMDGYPKLNYELI